MWQLVKKCYPFFARAKRMLLLFVIEVKYVFDEFLSKTRYARIFKILFEVYQIVIIRCLNTTLVFYKKNKYY